jgi:DNA polymerase-3 subunit epsilon
MMIALIFDTETTGLIPHPSAKKELRPRIIEWGGIIVDANGKEINEFNVLINPGIPLPPEITKITGITEDDLKGQPSFAEAAPLIAKLFAQADTLIAHNLPFDSTMMRNELERCGLLEGWPWPARNICTVQEHAEEWGYRPKLIELYAHYMGKPLAQTHRAIDDVRALKEICIAAKVIKAGGKRR